MKKYKVTSIKKENVDERKDDLSSMYPIKIKTTTVYGIIGDKKSLFNPSN
ncbi:hypothetical protein BC5_0036 [Bacillus phage BC-5]|uniref:Uncharacterized protein n=1 Tax=Bacillus phage BC-5 TaxID=3020389 RepID=A0AAF0BTD3_9CAUD|nr:hypothetical protein BC5_0036 [Bacillus phage BC-5]